MEGLLLFNSTEIAALLSFPLLINHLRSAFSRSHAFSSPLRHHHSIQSSTNTPCPATGTLLLMPAWSHPSTCPYVGVKIAAVFPGNLQRGLPALAASYLLSSSVTGEQLAFMDGNEITLWRTSCVSALAADYLARRDAKLMVMVGAGALAPYLIKAHVSVRPSLQKVFIWNRTPARAKVLVEVLKSELNVEVLETCLNLEEVIRGADLISCATLSDKSLVLGSWLKPGAHLDLVGSFTPSMRECDKDALAKGRLYIDTEAALQEAGELVGFTNTSDLRSLNIVGTLAQLTTEEKKGRLEADEITVFKSVGCAMVDLVTAQLVYEKRRHIAAPS